MMYAPSEDLYRDRPNLTIHNAYLPWRRSLDSNSTNPVADDLSVVALTEDRREASGDFTRLGAEGLKIVGAHENIG
jgi:hypothetical protein